MLTREPDVEVFRNRLHDELLAIEAAPGGWNRVRSALAERAPARRLLGRVWLLPAAAALVLLGTATGIAAAQGFSIRVVPAPQVQAPPYPTSIRLVCGMREAQATPTSLDDARRKASFPILIEAGAEPTRVEWISFPAGDPQCAPLVRLTYRLVGSIEVVQEGATGQGPIPVAVTAGDQYEATSLGGKQLFIHYTDGGRIQVAAILWQAEQTQGNVVFDRPVSRDRKS